MSRKFFTKNAVRNILVISLALSFIGLCGCSSASWQNTQQDVAEQNIVQDSKYTKDFIQNELDKEGTAVFNVSWSPDDSMVAFIRTEEQTDNSYVWKVGQNGAVLIAAAEPTTSGFSWSPDSQYFLINVGHMGPGTITSTLVDAQNLKVSDAQIQTLQISEPLWSPDSRYLALVFDDTDKGQKGIDIFYLEKQKTKNLLNSSSDGGFYLVKDWQADGTIVYTEYTAQGELIDKTIQGPELQ